MQLFEVGWNGKYEKKVLKMRRRPCYDGIYNSSLYLEWCLQEKEMATGMDITSFNSYIAGFDHSSLARKCFCGRIHVLQVNVLHSKFDLRVTAMAVEQFNDPIKLFFVKVFPLKIS